MIQKYPNKIYFAQVFLIFICLFFIYIFIIIHTSDNSNDMKGHAFFAKEMSEGKILYAGNFILYGLINIFSFCLSSIFSLFISSNAIYKLSLCILLAMATTYKFCLIYNHIECGVKKKCFIAALSLLFVAAIPIPSLFTTGYWYLGNYMPNVWHNSTTILLFPFAIILFDISIKQIEEYSRRRNIYILIFIFLNIFIKPSYFFVWVCIYPLFVICRYGLTKKFLSYMIPVIVGIVLLFIQYYYIYFITDDSSGVIIKPFKVYANFASLKMMPFNFLFSLLYPILYFVLNFKRLCKNTVFLFAQSGLFVSIVIFMLFSETGRRESHGNFGWQIIICTWLCFYITLSDWLKMKKIHRYHYHHRSQIILKISLVLYIFHVIFGILYLLRYMIKGTYS